MLQAYAGRSHGRAGWLWRTLEIRGLQYQPVLVSVLMALAPKLRLAMDLGKHDTTVIRSGGHVRHTICGVAAPRPLFFLAISDRQVLNIRCCRPG